MNEFLESFLDPWPWYVAGPIIGLTVPLLLILGNKNFGISSSLRHLCAMCVPAKIPFFQYDWKKELWNLFFVTGILIGGFIGWFYLSTEAPMEVSPALKAELSRYGIENSRQKHQNSGKDGCDLPNVANIDAQGCQKPCNPQAGKDQRQKHKREQRGGPWQGLIDDKLADQQDREADEAVEEDGSQSYQGQDFQREDDFFDVAGLGQHGRRRT